jgi:Holliday junction resolvasome RuvABC endonuclease subunit
VVLDKNKKLISYTLLTPKHSDLKERCTLIVEGTLQFVSKYKNKETLIIIETPAFMAKGRVIDLAMLVGGVFYSLRSRGYNCLLVPPTTHKKTFTGSGKASKEETIASLPEGVKELFLNESKKIDDLADAYSLAFYGITSN